MHPALGTIVAVFALAALVYLMVRFSKERYTQTTGCPATGEAADIQFVCRTGPLGGPGEKVDVTRCSALDDPMVITCDKACVDHTVEPVAAEA